MKSGDQSYPLARTCTGCAERRRLDLLELLHS